MNSPRAWAVMGLMAMTAALVQVRGDVDRVPPSEPLDQMPKVMGAWTGTDLGLDPGVLQVLGKGVFLNRIYVPSEVKPTAEGRTPHSEQVGLFIGYFPTQRTGQSIHSPQNCLPGAGWVFETSGVADLTSATGKPIQVGEYLISNGTTKEEVLYWYRSHGRSMASDYVAKFYMLLDSIRYNRTDAALVRVVTPVSPGETREAAHQRAVSFAEGLSPLLPAYIPD